jgi:hypothetical protein
MDLALHKISQLMSALAVQGAGLIPALASQSAALVPVSASQSAALVPASAPQSASLVPASAPQSASLVPASASQSASLVPASASQSASLELALALQGASLSNAIDLVSSLGRALSLSDASETVPAVGANPFDGIDFGGGLDDAVDGTLDVFNRVLSLSDASETAPAVGANPFDGIDFGGGLGDAVDGILDVFDRALSLIGASETDAAAFDEIEIDGRVFRAAKNDGLVRATALHSDKVIDVLRMQAGYLVGVVGERQEDQQDLDILLDMCEHLGLDGQAREAEKQGAPFDSRYRRVLAHPVSKRPYAPLCSVLFLKGEALRFKFDFFAALHSKHMFSHLLGNSDGSLRASITAYEVGSTIERAISLVVHDLA